jgi:hypothetical protein
MVSDFIEQAGVLSLKRLYVGSKSEGFYAVFDSEDGNQFRVRVQGRLLTDSVDPLIPYYGRRVRIIGEVDRRMGHKRLTLQSDAHGIHGIDIFPVDPESEG